MAIFNSYVSHYQRVNKHIGPTLVLPGPTGDRWVCHPGTSASPRGRCTRLRGKKRSRSHLVGGVATPPKKYEFVTSSSFWDDDLPWYSQDLGKIKKMFQITNQTLVSRRLDSKRHQSSALHHPGVEATTCETQWNASTFQHSVFHIHNGKTMGKP